MEKGWEASDLVEGDVECDEVLAEKIGVVG